MPQAQGRVSLVARLVLSGVGILALALVPLSAACADKAVVFRPAAEGIERAQLSAEGQTVHAFRIDLDRARLRIVPAGGERERQPVSMITAAAQKAEAAQAVAINASFFTEDDRAIGAVVDEGRVLSRRAVKGWGALIIEKADAKAAPRARISLGSELRLDRDAPPPVLVVQGTPRLVVNGEIVKLKRQTAARTAVCAMGQHVLLVVTEPLEATALALLLRDRLGCKDALNLDGGPSTQLHARLGMLRLDIEGGWGVPNALLALPGR
jgi:uncharacterized protein YigE (DUF2233 family)